MSFDLCCMSTNATYFDQNRNDLKGCGTYIVRPAVVAPSIPVLLLRMTPDWFVSPTTVRIGKVTFTSGGKATVSVFVCPAGFTASSWLTMLTTSNWDTMNGWMMDRSSVDCAGIHETLPTSTKDAYLLEPDDSIFVATSGAFELTDVTIVLELPTYKTIVSNVKSLSNHVHRAQSSVVSYQWATIRSAERWTVDSKKIMTWLETAPNSDIARILEMIPDSDDEDEEKDNLTDCD